jgi:ubiquitin-protein ligase
LRRIKAIQNILAAPKVDGEFCGTFNQEAFKLYKEDKTQFESIAKEWTEKYAYE